MAAASSKWLEFENGPRYYKWRLADLREAFPDIVEEVGRGRYKILDKLREQWAEAVPDPIPPRRYECWMTTEIKAYAENELGLPHTREGYLARIREYDESGSDSDEEPEPEPAGYAEAMETYDKWNHGELRSRAAASINRCYESWEPLKTLASILSVTLDELTEPIGAAYELLQKKYGRLDRERKAALRKAAGVADASGADYQSADPIPILACRGEDCRPCKPEDPPSEGFPSWQAVADCFRVEREFGEKMADVTDAKILLLEMFTDSLYERALDRIDELAEEILPEVAARTNPAAANETTAYMLWPDLSITSEKGGDLFGTRSRFGCGTPVFPSAVFDFEPAVMTLVDASAVREMGVLWLQQVLAKS